MIGRDTDLEKTVAKRTRQNKRWYRCTRCENESYGRKGGSRSKITRYPSKHVAADGKLCAGYYRHATPLKYRGGPVERSNKLPIIVPRYRDWGVIQVGWDYDPDRITFDLAWLMNLPLSPCGECGKDLYVTLHKITQNEEHRGYGMLPVLMPYYECLDCDKHYWVYTFAASPDIQAIQYRTYDLLSRRRKNNRKYRQARTEEMEDL